MFQAQTLQPDPQTKYKTNILLDYQQEKADIIIILAKHGCFVINSNRY